MKKLVICILLAFCVSASAQKPYRILNSFNAGELTGLLSAREDLAKYQSGCSLMENFFPLPQGGAQKRPGTKYIAESKNNTKIRLLPFEFSTEQSYIIELGNQYLRFYTNDARVTYDSASEDLSTVDANIVAHWKLNDNLATTTVIDANLGDHNGVATTNTQNLHLNGKAGTGCFDFKKTLAVEVNDHASFTFDDSADQGFSIAAWIYIEVTGEMQVICAKWSENNKLEWVLGGGLNKDFLSLTLYDETETKQSKRIADDTLTAGWHYVVATYDAADGSWSGNTAANFIKLYVDGAKVDSTATNVTGYVRMRDTAVKVTIGANYDSADALRRFWDGKIDNVAIFNDVLSASEIAALYVTTSATYELETPYLTADLFELKIKQSADVLYITHPDYETRKLSRIGNDDWQLEAMAIDTGPFKTQNTVVTKTLTASATTGSVTLTASGFNPFITGTTAGHLPSGAATTSKSQTGALFELVHPLDTLEYKDTLEDDYAASTTEGVSWMDCNTLYKGTEWSFTTAGTWLGTVEVQRNYTIGAAHGASGWESVLQFSGVTTARNVTTTGTEDDGDADYRVIFTDDTSGTIIAYFSTDQTEHAGIVEITAVASGVSATGTVISTLASTGATHKWSEGAWSNYRGWPRTVAFFEDRLVFGGNISQPDTIWCSVTGDYENLAAGVEDDDALNFTISSRQVNVIQWLIGKDKILVGTSGAEWTLSGEPDEPLTPSNVKAEQHSAYGSADLQGTLANESVLFFQRGTRKMRELAYNWELDSYVAPDMTILAKDIAKSGVTDVAFQQIPDSILWCVRNDGNMATFTYERKEQITSWSRLITDGDFESVAVINGTNENEVWVSVERTIDSNAVRYIERFHTRDFNSTIDHAFYVDCGATYSTDVNVISDLDHLEGEDVFVLADGNVIDNDGNSFSVSSNTVTLGGVYAKVQIGLPYTAKLRTMPLSWVGGEMTIQGRIKRINTVISRWYESGDFYIGHDVDNKELCSIIQMTTSEDRKTFPPGHDRPADVFIYQYSPEPLTLIALMIEFQVY